MTQHAQAALLIGIIYGVPIFLLLFGRRFASVRWLFRLHHWRYHNPYDRTCQVCGRHEVEYGFDMSLRNGWWEVHHDGYRAMPCNRNALVVRQAEGGE